MGKTPQGLLVLLAGAAFLPRETQTFFCKEENVDYSGNDITSFEATEEECRDACNEMDDCIAGVMDTDNGLCWLKGTPLGSRDERNDRDTLRKYCDEIVVTDYEKCIFSNVDFEEHELESYNNVASMQQCDQYCQDEDDCVLNSLKTNGKCALKKHWVPLPRYRDTIEQLKFRHCNAFPCLKRGQRYNNHNLKAVSNVADDVSCWNLCVDKPNCLAVVYDEDTEECMLKDEIDDGAQDASCTAIFKFCPFSDFTDPCSQSGITSEETAYLTIEDSADPAACRESCLANADCLRAEHDSDSNECRLKKVLPYLPVVTNDNKITTVRKYCPEWGLQSVGFKGTRYTFIVDRMAFSKAQNVCEDEGVGSLVEIETAEENEFLKYAASEMALAAAGFDVPFFIGMTEAAPQWISGSPLTFDNWCAGIPATGPVTMIPTEGLCWGLLANTTVAGAICESPLRRRTKTLADFVASEYLDTCHMISKYPIHAYEESVTYGTHFEAEKFCSDVGAELVVIRDEAENQAIVDMANCVLTKEADVNEAVFDLTIGYDPAGFKPTGFQAPGDMMCTQLSAKTGQWESRNLDECKGYGAFSSDAFRTHVVCRKNSKCDGSWQLLLRHFVTNSEVFTSSAEAESKDAFDLSASLFSRLNTIDNFMTAEGNFHFRLVYPELQDYEEWIQTSNPTQNAGSAATGFEAIKTPVIDSRFEGLGLNQAGASEYSLIDYKPDDNDALYGVGVKKLDSGTIPGPGQGVKHVELHAYVYDASCFSQDTVLTLGANVGAVTMQATADACHRECQKTPGCWQFSYAAGLSCTLKDDTAVAAFAGGAVSGPRYCGVKKARAIKSCGVPNDAPAESLFANPVDVTDGVCQGDFVTYTCNAGGINVRQDNRNLNSLDVFCENDGVYNYPHPDWPFCIASETCHQLRAPDFGRFTCDDDKLPIGAKCQLSCESGYLPRVTDITVICTYDNVTEEYSWSRDVNELQCVPQVGLVVGGIDSHYQYVSSVEAFAPTSPSCHGKAMKPFPIAVAGAVSGLVKGIGVVCGGAVEKYVDCAPSEGVLEGTKCARNAHHIVTAGGAKWYTGPKSAKCFFYDHENTQDWVHAVDLTTARAYASAVSMPDGSLMIMGGVGVDQILDSIEIVERSDIDGPWTVRTASHILPQPVFGHCSAVVPDGSVVVTAGGFDGQDHSDNVFRYDAKSSSWRIEASGLNTPRFDHVCKASLADGVQVVAAAGGWNDEKVLNSIEIMNVDQRYWTEEGENTNLPTTTVLDLESNPSYLRRSAALFGDAMVGGVACGIDGQQERCVRLKSAIHVDAVDVDNRQVLAFEMTEPRSSHTILHLPVTYVCT